MKIDYISDLHLDFWINGDINGKKLDDKIEKFINMIQPAGGDVLVIAGDLTHYNSQLVSLFKQLKQIYNEIVVTWGNHDLYLISNSMRNKYKYYSLNRLIELKEICYDAGVTFLDGQTVKIGDVVFGGTGMWYDLPTPSDIDDWKRIMNDSRLIMEKKSLSCSFDTQKFYNKEKAKLEKIKCDVLISHVPCFKIPDQMMDPLFIGNESNKFYHAPLYELVESTNCKIHVAGHTHTSYDFQYGAVNLKINPLGYPMENTYTMIKQFKI